MLTFIQLLEELSKEDIVLAAPEVARMRERFGDKTLQMGHLREDGGMQVPVDCIFEAVHSLDNRELSHAIESLKSDQMVSMLQSVDTLVEHVSAARKRKLERLVEAFQSERDDDNAHQRWAEIEKVVFGVEFQRLSMPHIDWRNLPRNVRTSKTGCAPGSARNTTWTG